MKGKSQLEVIGIWSDFDIRTKQICQCLESLGMKNKRSNNLYLFYAK